MNKRPAYRAKMEGLSFLAMDRGRKVIAIRADSFIVRNVKIGFFSFGMASVAALENVTIDLYSADGRNRTDIWPDNENKKSQDVVLADNQEVNTAPATPAVNQSSQPAPTKNVPARQKPTNSNIIDFKGVLSKETFASFPAKSVTSIEAAPIVLTLYADEKVLTRISAQKAKVRFRDKDVLFDGDVVVVSGARELRSASLRLSPADGLMEARQYSMAAKGRNTAGERLQTDLLLMKR